MILGRIERTVIIWYAIVLNPESVINMKLWMSAGNFETTEYIYT